jgi:hypothetical protein
LYFSGRVNLFKKKWLTTETLRTLLLGIDASPLYSGAANCLAAAQCEKEGPALRRQGVSCHRGLPTSILHACFLLCAAIGGGASEVRRLLFKVQGPTVSTLRAFDKMSTRKLLVRIPLLLTLFMFLVLVRQSKAQVNSLQEIWRRD